MQDVFNFFGSSAPRWALLALGNKVSKKTLKKACPTRWEVRHDAVFVLQERFIDAVKWLTKISLTTKKPDERNASISLKKKLESSEFILIICLCENILRILNVVSKLLQGNSFSIEMASTLMDQSIFQINQSRNNYDEILSKSKELCAKWNISVPFHSVRKIFANKKFDDFDGDSRLDINEENFKIKVFLPVCDTILFKLHSRFEEMLIIVNNLKFLSPPTIVE